jgi:hypothetical protein
MNKLEEKIELYKAEAKKLGLDLDEKLIEETTKALVPAIYKADAEIVSCSDANELERVRESFLKKKLELKRDDEDLDKLIKEVCQEMGTSNRKKYRALFYSLLKKKIAS